MSFMKAGVSPLTRESFASCGVSLPVAHRLAANRQLTHRFADALERLTLLYVAIRTLLEHERGHPRLREPGEDDHRRARARPGGSAGSASSPSMPGIERSSRTTFGWSSAISSIPTSRVAALPDHAEPRILLEDDPQQPAQLGDVIAQVDVHHRSCS